jgi:hypothetical protein
MLKRTSIVLSIIMGVVFVPLIIFKIGLYLFPYFFSQLTHIPWLVGLALCLGIIFLYAIFLAIIDYIKTGK